MFWLGLCQPRNKSICSSSNTSWCVDYVRAIIVLEHYLILINCLMRKHTKLVLTRAANFTSITDFMKLFWFLFLIFCLIVWFHVLYFCSYLLSHSLWRLNLHSALSDHCVLMIICVLIPPHFLFPSEDDKHLLPSWEQTHTKTRANTCRAQTTVCMSSAVV